jgi:cyclic dehypoxanthinyl futalosine synthase
MRTAHRLGLKTTATMMFGHLETYGERVESMRRIRDLQDQTGGFTAFIPWPLQPDNTAMASIPKTGAHGYLKTLAIARLYLDNVENIQASWVTQGPEVAQLSLLFGANDMGSTMIEENVVAAAGVSFKLDEAELCSLIRGVGLTPARRNTYYRIVDGHHKAR